MSDTIRCIECGHAGTADRVGEQIRCGRCGAPVSRDSWLAPWLFMLGIVSVVAVLASLFG